MRNQFRISPNFLLSEFQDPTTGEVILNPFLVRKLQTLRSGLNRPVVITSGFRTLIHNRAVNGAEHSYHLTGDASDIIVAGVSIKELAERAERIGFGGIGIYKNHLHVDVGPRRRW